MEKQTPFMITFGSIFQGIPYWKNYWLYLSM